MCFYVIQKCLYLDSYVSCVYVPYRLSVNETRVLCTTGNWRVTAVTSHPEIQRSRDMSIIPDPKEKQDSWLFHFPPHNIFISSARHDALNNNVFEVAWTTFKNMTQWQSFGFWLYKMFTLISMFRIIQFRRHITIQQLHCKSIHFCTTPSESSWFELSTFWIMIFTIWIWMILHKFGRFHLPS